MPSRTVGEPRAKSITYANMYHESPDWDLEVIDLVHDFACSQILKMGISIEWTSWTGSYDNLKDQFLNWYRTKHSKY